MGHFTRNVTRIDDAGTSSCTRKTAEKAEICILQVIIYLFIYFFCNLVIFYSFFYLSLLMDFTTETTHALCFFFEGLTDEITSRQAKKEEN